MSAFNFNKLIGLTIASRYCLTETIGSGAMGAVYKAMSLEDPLLQVAIKIIATNRKIESVDLLRFQKEAAMMSQLVHPNIIYFHELGLLKQESQALLPGGYYIVMEVAAGRSLRDIIHKDGRKDLDFFFDVALQATSALDYTHGKNIVHRDIKPQNIIVGEGNDNRFGNLIKILDFGVARLGDAMNFTGANEEDKDYEIAGTPLYMAPEQTSGDVNADQRVDLYSLGCVLYEILTGRPPFVEKSFETLMRAHAETPPPMISEFRPEVPLIIERIVMKLLEKDPGSRYFSAFSLQADLIQARRHLGSGDAADIMQQLATRDSMVSLNAKIPFIGRKQELAALCDTYSKISQEETARSRIQVLQGPAGCGKTRLISEYKHWLSGSKVKFVHCSFHQHENTLPFNALANAFNDYLLRTWSANPREVEDLKYRFQNTLGDAGKIVAAVIPGIIPYLKNSDETPSESDDGASDSLNLKMFKKVFFDFIKCLTTAQQTLVFILDNLQWADQDSLKLIDDFLSFNNAQRIYVVLAYRDFKESAHKDALLQFIGKFSKLKRRYNVIALHEFDAAETEELIRNMFSGEMQESAQLAEALRAKQSGFPLHLIEAVKKLVADEVIYLGSDSQWNWQVEKLRKSIISVASIDLTIAGLEKLAVNMQQMLSMAAVLGNQFQFELLRAISGRVSDQLHADLNSSLEAGLLVRGTSDLPVQTFGRTYEFTHKKIRDTIYLNIPAEQKRQLHHKALEIMPRFFQQKVDRIIFTLAHHVNCSLLPAANDHGQSSNGANGGDLELQAYQLNVAAARHAEDSLALTIADRYYKQALDIGLALVSRKQAPADYFATIEAWADCLMKIGQFERAKKLYRSITSKDALEEEGLHVAGKLLESYLLCGDEKEIEKIIVSRQHLLQGDGIEINLEASPHLFRLGNWLVNKLGNDNFTRKINERIDYAILKAKAGEANGAALDDYLEFYHLAFRFQVVRKFNLALAWHVHAWKRATKGEAGIKSLLLLLCDRLVILHAADDRESAKICVSLLEAAVKRLGTSSLAAWVECQISEYHSIYHERTPKLAKKFHAALDAMKVGVSPLWRAEILVRSLMTQLLTGEFEKVYGTWVQQQGVIPVGSPLNSQAFAVTMMALFLDQKRQQLVVQVGRFLRVRGDIYRRVNDPAVLMAMVLDHICSGDYELASRLFNRLILEYRVNRKYAGEVFFAEFWLIYLNLIPAVFLYETGREISPSQAIREFAAGVSGVQAAHAKRSYTAAILFRQLRHGAVANITNIESFNRLLLASRDQQNRLMFILGVFLMTINRNTTPAERELSWKKLRKYGSKGFSQLQYTASVVLRKASSQNQEALGRPDPNVHGQMLEQLYRQALDQRYKLRFAESFASLEQVCGFERYAILLIDPITKSLSCHFQSDGLQNRSAMESYLSLYAQLHSALLMPASDTPWSHSYVGNATLDGVATNKLFAPGETRRQLAAGTLLTSDLDDTVKPGDRQRAEQSVDNSAIDADPTLKSGQMSQAAGDLDLDATLKPGQQPGAGIGSSALIGQSGHGTAAFSGQRRQNAILPMFGPGQNIGVVFIEGVINQLALEPHLFMAELNDFSNNLGLLMMLDPHYQQVVDAFTQTYHFNGVQRYHPGATLIERVSWLDSELHGKRHAASDPGWTHGFQQGDNYFLVQLEITGKKQETATRYASMLWYEIELLRMKSLAMNQWLQTDEIVERIHVWLASVPFDKVGAASVKLLCLNSKEGQIEGKIWGGHQDLILSSGSRLIPQNQPFSRLANTRDFYCYQLSGQLTQGAFILISNRRPLVADVKKQLARGGMVWMPETHENTQGSPNKSGFGKLSRFGGLHHNEGDGFALLLYFKKSGMGGSAVATAADRAS